MNGQQICIFLSPILRKKAHVKRKLIHIIEEEKKLHIFLGKWTTDMVNKVETWNWDFDEFTSFENTTNESENHIFKGWFVSVCVWVTSITQKHIIAETPIFVFYMRITCRFDLKLCMKIRYIVHVQGHTKEFE